MVVSSPTLPLRDLDHAGRFDGCIPLVSTLLAEHGLLLLQVALNTSQSHGNDAGRDDAMTVTPVHVESTSGSHCMDAQFARWWVTRSISRRPAPP